MTQTAFQFLEPGLLVDQELELVEPHARWIDEHIAACHHRLTEEHMPEQARITRTQLSQLVHDAPRGRFGGDSMQQFLPSYTFWMRVKDPEAPLQIVGSVGLRVGNTHDIEYLLGHIGYHVYPAARGHHFAERACRLLFPLARRHGLSPLWITCNPDNIPSRRTCERLGGALVDIVPIPVDHAFFKRGEREKCRYRFDI